MIWIVFLIAACAFIGFIARTASERGRSSVLWGILSGIAGVFGQLGGMLILERSMHTVDTGSSSAGVIGGYLASLLGPLGCMAGVLWLLTVLPERVPWIGGTRWPVHRMPSGDMPALDCYLSVDRGRLQLGDQPPVEAKDITEIATDGECLRLSWSGQSVLLMPSGKSRTPAQSAKHSLGLAARLRTLLSL